MSENLMWKAFEIVKSFDRESERYAGFLAIAPYLPEELLPEALELVKGLKYDIQRCYALQALAPSLAKVTR